jgi:AcrR family transcriptional regulator
LPQSEAAATPDATGVRRGDARQRLLTAAADLFCAQGWLPVTVEDIVTAAGVSRVTFYRQFADKTAITVELFATMSHALLPRYARIATLDHRDPAVVRAWIGDIFAADRAHPALLRALTEALVAAPDFLAKAQQLIGQLIEALGATLPAFAVTPADPPTRRQWLEASLLLYEIFDQSNHAALRAGTVPEPIAADPLMIDILADRFLDYVARYAPGTQSRV